MEEDEKTPETPQDTKEETSLKSGSSSSGDQKVTRREVRLERKRGKKIGRGIFIVVIIIIIAIAGFFVIRGQSPKIELKPQESTSIEETTPTTSPSPTAEPIERGDVSIQLLNGTGIAKEAAYLSGQLEDLGYSQIDAGNADNSDYVDTNVTFDEALPEEVIDDIIAKLEEIYEEVNSDTSPGLGDYQVKVIIGYKKGYTPSPTPTLTPTPEPEEDNVTPTSSPSATPSI